MREIMKLGVILGLVCAIAGASLAVVNGITIDIIADRQEQALMAKLQTLVPGAERFEKMETEEGGVYYVGWDNNSVVGAVVEGTAKGYGGEMNLLVAIDGDGKISGVEVGSHGETIGIGTRVMEPEFLQQFSGHDSTEQVVAGQGVDVITGATASSRAVMSSVNNALELYRVYVLNEDPDEEWNLARVADGVYAGSAPGYAAEIKVEVTVQAGSITKVEVVAIDDTPTVYPDAVAQIPGRIIEKQHWKVDAVSGATASSEGIMAAVQAALPDMSLKFDQIADGTYEGVGNGFNDDIKVQVEVVAGKVTKVEVLAHKETDYVSDPALADIPKAIVEQQSIKVDAVSGATGTSNGLIEAVINALEAAPKR